MCISRAGAYGTMKQRRRCPFPRSSNQVRLSESDVEALAAHTALTVFYWPASTSSATLGGAEQLVNPLMRQRKHLRSIAT
jgi:hypothetical protein